MGWIGSAPRILIFSIAMGADYSFYVKTIETHAGTFLPLNNSAIGTVIGIRFEKYCMTFFDQIFKRVSILVKQLKYGFFL